MSKPSQKRKAKKAKAKKAKVVQTREFAHRLKVLETILEDRGLDLSLRHNPIRPHDLRVCGDCQVCCFVMAVEKVDSIKYEKCKHQCSSGCGIHQKAPEECQHFDCTWKLEKLLGNEYRPDRCGFMMYAKVQEKLDLLILLALESYEGAWQTPGVYEKLSYVSRKLNMVIIYLDDRNKALGMCGPPDLLKYVQNVSETLEEAVLDED